ncbi:MAG: hypothetical protein ABI723_11505 [Bacteroidia bacterium]
MIVTKKPLTNVQMEILKLYNLDISDTTLLELKDLISDFFLEKARKRADEIWVERGYTEETVKQWLNED